MERGAVKTIAFFQSKFFRTMVGAVVLLLAILTLLDLRPVAPDFLAHSEPRAKLKKTRPIPITEVVKPQPPAPMLEAATPKAQPLANDLKPQVASTLKGFGEGGGEFGGGFSEKGTGGARGSGAVAKTAVERNARVTSRASLVFPAIAREKNLSGYVVIEVLVGTSGQVERSRIISANPPGVFETSALDSVKQWKFDPAVASGQAVASWVTQKIRFDLE